MEINTQISPELLGLLIPKAAFLSAKKNDLLNKVFTLGGISAFDDDSVKSMSDATADNVGRLSFYFKSDSGFHTNIPVRQLLALNIDGKEDETVLTTMQTEMAAGAGTAKGAIPSSFKVESVEVAKEGTTILYPYGAYTAFQDELKKHQVVFDALTQAEKDDNNTLSPYQRVYRNRTLIAGLKGKEGLIDAKQEPLKTIKISYS
jgi:hypothetical protein